MAKKNETRATESDALNQSEALFLRFKKPIIIAVCAIVVIIAGIILYNNFVAEPREDEASTALSKGQTYFAAQQYDKALKGDGAGYAGFINIASDYSSTKAGNLANLYAGLCYANQAKPDWKSAQEDLDKCDTQSDQNISPAAVAAAANAYANNGDLAKAVDLFQKAADMADSRAFNDANNSLSPVFLKEAGMLLEKQGKKADALKIYQDIKKKYVNSPAYQDIDKYIERASN